VRITVRGASILIAGALLVFGGYWFGYADLVALGCAALVAVGGAVAFVAWRPPLSVRRAVEPDRVIRGEPSQVTLDISNASRFFGASVMARDRCGGISVPVPLVRLRAGRATTVTYPVPTSRRGVVEVGPLEITRRDPLALVGVVRRYGQAGQVWVRPRIHPIGAVPVGLSRSMDGRVDRVPHGSITFAALREYVVGDDLRRVHWRTSARVGELMVREHVDTSLPRVVVLLDNRASAHTSGGGGESTFEAACEAAASIAVAAFREEVQVELCLVRPASSAGPRSTGPESAYGGGQQPVAGARPALGARLGGRLAVGSILDQLAEAELTGADQAGTVPDPLRSAVERLRVRRLGDTLLYLVGRADQDELGQVAGLRGAYPSIIAAVFGTVESGLTSAAGMLVVGATDGADFAAAWDGIRAW
jgi:Protein of unknown function DUF58